MIQDIAPRHYDNAYHPTQPKAGDRVFFYHEGSTLLSAATGEPFTWEEVTDLTGGWKPPTSSVSMRLPFTGAGRFPRACWRPLCR